MRLTKFQHACVLVEDDQHTALFDPGDYTWQSGLLVLEHIPKLDYVLITHEHFDHFSLHLCRSLAKRFPAAVFISTSSVVAQLLDTGIQNARVDGDEQVDVALLQHDGMAPLGPTPPCENVRFHYKDKISHPGDTLRLSQSRDILFLPLAGPWEATVDAVDLGLRLKPRVIVPIHDKMWDTEWQRAMYERLENFYAEQGITFVKTIDGESFEL